MTQTAFPDHHPYTDAEIGALVARAAAQQARLVTTQKDWVRLPDAARAGITPVGVDLVFEPQDAALRAVQPLLAPKRLERAYG